MDISSDFIAQINDNALYNTFGIKVHRVADGQAESKLDANPAVCWPFPSQPHGGVLFTLMDTTMAWALLGLLEPGKNCTTIDLTIQYTAPAKDGPFLCRTKVSHITTRMGFIRGEIEDAGGRTVALGQGTFRIIGMDPFSI
jgi:uncharacterized protein (TIGR00369 family)